MREPDRLADRHAEADEVFGAHGFGSVENDGRRVRTRSECAAVFVLFVALLWWMKTARIVRGDRARMRDSAYRAFPRNSLFLRPAEVSNQKNPSQ